MARPINVVRISMTDVIDELAVSVVTNNTANSTAIKRFCDLFDIELDKDRMEAATSKYAKIAKRLHLSKK